MNSISSVTGFSLLVLKSSLRDIRSLAITSGLPVFMLFTFWITTRDGSADSQDLFMHMAPAICAMAVMMPGQTQAARLAGWRDSGTLRRLALAPVPVSASIIGISTAQVIMAVLQGFVLFLACLPAAGLHFGITVPIMLLGYMALISTAFITLGILLSALFSGPANTGYAYFAVFLPLFFLGSFPLEHLPPGIRVFIPWLPTTMGIQLVKSLFEPDGSNLLFSVCGLVVYALIFICAGVLLYRKKTV
ncbi:MAG: ABC transporter permease [Spirochaetales bacterium]|nr:ABC transporter permease [Spirochaetales bacterium]